MQIKLKLISISTKEIIGEIDIEEGERILSRLDEISDSSEDAFSGIVEELRRIGLPIAAPLFYRMFRKGKLSDLIKERYPEAALRQTLRNLPKINTQERIYWSKVPNDIRKKCIELLAEKVDDTLEPLARIHFMGSRDGEVKPVFLEEIGADLSGLYLEYIRGRGQDADILKYMFDHLEILGIARRAAPEPVILEGLEPFTPSLRPQVQLTTLERLCQGTKHFSAVKTPKEMFETLQKKDPSEYLWPGIKSFVTGALAGVPSYFFLSSWWILLPIIVTSAISLVLFRRSAKKRALPIIVEMTMILLKSDLETREDFFSELHKKEPTYTLVVRGIINELEVRSSNMTDTQLEESLYYFFDNL
ncbi:MAG: hypothetical protein HQ564_09275 [Candidatus Saganbacteria bacterium]|nr:hypothetical protein [Candidatus Saganbacteria bacterium]